jgi:hypothetical protein
MDFVVRTRHRIAYRDNEEIPGMREWRDEEEEEIQIVSRLAGGRGLSASSWENRRTWGVKTKRWPPPHLFDNQAFDFGKKTELTYPIISRGLRRRSIERQDRGDSQGGGILARAFWRGRWI